MTENKRFTIIDKEFISYYGGNGYLISNGECKIWLWHSKEESQKVCDKLNSIPDENEQLKKRIDRIDIILDDLNGAEYISRDDAIKALNKIDKAVR